MAHTPNSKMADARNDLGSKDMEVRFGRPEALRNLENFSSSFTEMIVKLLVFSRKSQLWKEYFFYGCNNCAPLAIFSVQ